MAKRPKGRLLNGVLLLNKSAGMTSNSALQQARRLFDAAKAGHTGSLDPLATGILPICFGESTKFAQYLLDADKRYQSQFCLGIKTTTSDAEGDELERKDASDITLDKVNQALASFRGEIEQIPSMFSALKHQGQPLYKMAREGKTIDRPPRKVFIHSIEVLDFEAGNPAKLTLDVHCTKGTYIRSIAEDLGQALGCGGHVATLHRSLTGDFTDGNAVTLGQLREELAALDKASIDSEAVECTNEAIKKASGGQLDHHLLSVDAPIKHLPSIKLVDHSVTDFRFGRNVVDTEAYRIAGEGGIVRVFSQAGDFLGVGEVAADNQVAPKRLIAENSRPISM
ncbi:MAG: tRNA pseudouridine(55) synthase TruB [Cellvibrionaceae bacterium]